MSRAVNPLKYWMLSNQYGDPERGIISADDYERFVVLLPSRPSAESMRMIVNGYRPPSWEMSFEIESVTGISAHDIRAIHVNAGRAA